MMDLTTYFTEKLLHVTSIKCPNTIAKAANRLDSVVLYVIEDPYGSELPTPTERIIEFVGTQYRESLRSGRSAMSGETGVSGVGWGGGHGSLVAPRARAVALALHQWLERGSVGDPASLVKRQLEDAKYDGPSLHQGS